jgi:hypothetical protein
MRLARLLLICLAFVVLGCGNNGGNNPTAAPANNAGGVTWSDYAPGLQSTIDSLAAAKNCNALQQQFDTADANNAATQSRTGHNNADLMSYIDAKMSAAGCH